MHKPILKICFENHEEKEEDEVIAQKDCDAKHGDIAYSVCIGWLSDGYADSALIFVKSDRMS